MASSAFVVVSPPSLSRDLEVTVIYSLKTIFLGSSYARTSE